MQHMNHFYESDRSRYWKSPQGISLRIRGFAQGFTYRVVNGAYRITGKTHGIRWMQWLTVGDDRVCVICLKAASGGRNGYYQTNWFTPGMPAHFGCRCQWRLILPPPDEVLKTQETRLDIARVQNVVDNSVIQEGELPPAIIAEVEQVIRDQMTRVPRIWLRGINQINLHAKNAFRIPEAIGGDYNTVTKNIRLSTLGLNSFQRLPDGTYGYAFDPKLTQGKDAYSSIKNTIVHELSHNFYRHFQRSEDEKYWSFIWATNNERMVRKYGKTTPVEGAATAVEHIFNPEKADWSNVIQNTIRLTHELPLMVGPKEYERQLETLRMDWFEKEYWTRRYREEWLSPNR